ncbi:MAG: prolyl oligopeptidase family serine peptidase [Flavisolibacter sp.]|nr:prolyl oligopeptidase family serine peptidase [Flavisolibacter sp.]
MMTYIRWIAMISLFFLKTEVFAQEVYYFKRGLTATIPNRYGREAIYTDHLAYALYTNTLKTPVEGAAFGTNDSGQQITWLPVEADTANRLFRRNSGRGGGGFGRSGYIYLTYTSDREKPALLNIKGSNSLYFNGVPHAGDPYSSGWLYIPVQLKKGLNEVYVRSAFATASLTFPTKPVLLNTEDPTLPFVVLDNSDKSLQGAVVVINTTAAPLRGLQIKSHLQGKELTSILPAIPPMSTRKVPFRMDGNAVTTAGKYDCSLTLIENGKTADAAKVTIEAVAPTTQYSSTFISGIDGSLQYYAVTPQTTGADTGSALFLSVHGAGVEAIGQARAYRSKDWGTLVAATNRRPRGFNWEDWGRLDALEVLRLAKEKFKPHPQRIYLTGHSMGGHGTWFLGATYPDQWAAIAPCAGYPTLKGYGSADGLIPDSSNIPMEQMLLRSGNQSDVIKLATNYKPLGVYVFHGDDDRTVSVNYARQMKKILADFQPDLSYYEYPGGGHWFGNESVDWKPIFDFFKWHTRPLDSAVNTIDFITANPGISSAYRWVAIQQQMHPLQLSRIQLQRNKEAKIIRGSTENIRLLKLDLVNFKAGDSVNITLDNTDPVVYRTSTIQDSIFLQKENGRWSIVAKPELRQKGPHRYGTFKDAFTNNMIFVYGTTGTKEENEWSLNKARFDAETWYYRGNGAVDIIADKEFSLAHYKDRGVILYGNKTTNAVWKILLNDCPIQVERNRITAGNKVWQGDDLSAYFVWPIRSSNVASVAVIGGSGIKGMNGATANQYFAGASGFPDFMIYGLDMLKKGPGEVKMAGFYDNDWKLTKADFIQSN